MKACFVKEDKTNFPRIGAYAKYDFTSFDAILKSRCKNRRKFTARAAMKESMDCSFSTWTSTNCLFCFASEEKKKNNKRNSSILDSSFHTRKTCQRFPLSEIQ